MSLEGGRHPKSRGPSKGEAGAKPRVDEPSSAAIGNERPGTAHLMQEVIGADNVLQALKRVEQNKGSPGIDGMRVEELRPYLRENWREIRRALLAGTYQPTAVKQQQIPKSGGGVRDLGIPTVLDRFIQQAVLQVLQPRFDPTFSKHSYGFRPGRRAHDAVKAAQKFVEQGKPWVVDVDLSRFFDRVNHDVLLGKLAKRIEDKQMLGLIRRYLEAGVTAGGVVIERHEGTPQGGPLSPLLANVLLDEIDKELERRGLSFCRYADDANVYVASKRAGDRVMASMRKLYAALRLVVNEDKSAVAPVEERKFLGFTFVRARKGQVQRRIADKALEAVKDRIRDATGRNCGRSLASIVEQLRRFLVGWIGYFGITEVRAALRDLDAWIRRRLRVVQLKQWRCGRTVYKHLRARGVAMPIAAFVAKYSRRYWWITHHRYVFVALPDKVFNDLGVPRLAA